KHAQVLGDERLRQLEPAFELAHAQLLPGEEAEDGATVGLGKRVEDGLYVLHVSVHTVEVICLSRHITVRTDTSPSVERRERWRGCAGPGTGADGRARREGNSKEKGDSPLFECGEA